MPRARVVGLMVAVVVALVAPVGASAQSGIYTQVLHSYQLHGSIPPCQFSSQQLEHALKGIDTYGAQYFQDFSSAVQSTLTAQASGVCEPAGAQRAPLAAHAPSIPARPLHLGAVGAATGASLPAPMLALAAFGVLFVLVAAAVLLTWWRGWSPPWGAAWRHGWAEAGYRAHDGWLDFVDWLRSGSESR